MSFAASLFARLRPTVLILHVWMGFVVAVCCTQFGPGTESIGVLGAYVSSLLLTVGDLIKDASGKSAELRINAVILALVAGLMLIYFTLQFQGMEELVAVVHAAVMSNLTAIKYLVRDEA